MANLIWPTRIPKKLRFCWKLVYSGILSEFSSVSRYSWLLSNHTEVDDQESFNIFFLFFLNLNFFFAIFSVHSTNFLIFNSSFNFPDHSHEIQWDYSNSNINHRYDDLDVTIKVSRNSWRQILYVGQELIRCYI